MAADKITRRELMKKTALLGAGALGMASLATAGRFASRDGFPDLGDFCGDIIPCVDVTYDLGSPIFRFAETHSKKIFAMDGGGTHTLTNAGVLAGETLEVDGGTSTLESSGKGSFASGFVESDEHPSFIKATGDGSFAQGITNPTPNGGYCYLLASGEGAFAQGRVVGNADDVGEIVASGDGSFAHGIARGQNGVGQLIATNLGSVTFGYAWGTAAGTSTLSSTGVCSFAAGYVKANSTISALEAACFAQGAALTGSSILSGVDSSIGNFAQGYAGGGGDIQGGGDTSLNASVYGGAFAQGFCVLGQITADGNGCFAQGYVGNFYGYVPAAGSNYIKATYGGNFAQGWAGTYYDNSAAHILASAYGAFAQGIAWGGHIEATGGGAFAQGNSGGTGNITATGNGAFAQGTITVPSTYGINATGEGAFAHGWADTASIIASAANAAQFGAGTNNTADSLQVGSNVHLIPGGASRIGPPATHLISDNVGDTYWVGDGAGLSFGEIFANNVTDTITIAIAGQANKVQITSFAVNGASNNSTPDHTNDHITITKAGMYLCNVSLHVESAAAGGGDVFGFSVYKNNGTGEFPNCHGHRKLAGGGGDVGSISLSGILDLALNDTIELWCWNEDSADDIIIEDVTLSLVQIGGT